MRNSPIIALIALLALAASTTVVTAPVVTAQGGSILSPSSVYRRAEGPGVSGALGAHSEGRYQLVDGNLGSTPRSLKALSFRYDHRVYTASGGMGRTWKSVTIDMSDGNLAAFSSTYSANSLSTPARVFSNTMSWPTQIGARKTMPDSFGLTIPFGTKYSYAGKKPLLTDFRFAGGTMANNAAWGPGRFFVYFLDSFNVGHTSVGPSISLGKIKGGCVDSAVTTGMGASVTMHTEARSVNHPNLLKKLTMQFRASATGFAPKAPVAMAFAFNANLAGTVIPGVNCNRIHLDLNRALFIGYVAADATGSIRDRYFFGIPNGTLSYLAMASGLNMVVQCAWADSKNRNMMFSAGSRNALMPISPFATREEVRMNVAYGGRPLHPMSTFLHKGDPGATPLLRYAY